MDNRRIDVTSVGEDALRMALSLVWPGATGGKASHYKIVNLKQVTTYYGEPTHRHLVESKEVTEAGAKDPGVPTLILLWNAERDALPLPYPLELDETIPFVAGWLKRVPRGSQPDHDGDNDKGFRVFTESWGHVAGHHYAIVGVQPEWAMYGK